MVLGKFHRIFFLANFLSHAQKEIEPSKWNCYWNTDFGLNVKTTEFYFSSLQQQLPFKNSHAKFSKGEEDPEILQLFSDNFSNYRSNI